MFKQLVIENFENHLKSKFNFEDGFNLIHGKSDTGKTSIIRALKLVLYNQWHPESLRVGKKNCKISLKTERGTVTVLRGKENTWTVTKNNGESKEFKKIGKSILPEVVEITGVKPVKLGNCEAMPNIMDQLEGHFLISEIDGENVSGSLRAQIVDEISGLSGMEGLIRELSLDNLRNAKEIKEIEINNESIKKKLHDEKQLELEIKQNQYLEKLFEEHSGLSKQLKNINDYKIRYGTMKAGLDKLISEIKQYRNIGNIISKIGKFRQDGKQWVGAIGLSKKHQLSLNYLKELEGKIDNIDYVKVHALLNQFNHLSNKYSQLCKIASRYGLAKSQLDSLYKKIDKVDYVKVYQLLNNFRQLFEKYNQSKGLAKQYAFAKAQLGNLDKKIDRTDYVRILSEINKLKTINESYNKMVHVLDNYKTARLNFARQSKIMHDRQNIIDKMSEEYLEKMKSVKVCPLTGRPTRSSCFEDL